MPQTGSVLEPRLSAVGPVWRGWEVVPRCRWSLGFMDGDILASRLASVSDVGGAGHLLEGWPAGRGSRDPAWRGPPARGGGGHGREARAPRADRGSPGRPPARRRSTDHGSLA